MYRFFPPEFRTASIVHRWSVVRTIQRDSLANHSFYVTFYAHQIAVMLKWSGPMDLLMLYALLHDADELFTGDVVSPVKRNIVDEEKLVNYVNKLMYERLVTVADSLTTCKLHSRWPEIQAIVKAADRLDACLFMTVDQRLGNTIVENRCRDIHEQAKIAWHKMCDLLPTEKTDRRTMRAMWSTVESEISWHKDLGGDGV